MDSENSKQVYILQSYMTAFIFWIELTSFIFLMMSQSLIRAHDLVTMK